MDNSVRFLFVDRKMENDRIKNHTAQYIEDKDSR